MSTTHSTHHPALAHQFDTLEQQQETSTLGMWMFLATEVMFFGGLFGAYVVYRWMYPEAFAAGSLKLDVTLGFVNTVVLISSSFTMVLAVYFAQTGRRLPLVAMLAATVVLGVVFLGIKAVEWTHDYHEGLMPGVRWDPAVWTEHAEHPVSPKQAEMFFVLYFFLTGLHALHMVIGFGVIAVVGWLAYRGRFSPEYYNPVEVTGLYWHFVDIIWIFLFPLLYLIRLH